MQIGPSLNMPPTTKVQTFGATTTMLPRKILGGRSSSGWSPPTRPQWRVRAEWATTIAVPPATRTPLTAPLILTLRRPLSGEDVPGLIAANPPARAIHPRRLEREKTVHRWGRRRYGQPLVEHMEKPTGPLYGWSASRMTLLKRACVAEVGHGAGGPRSRGQVSCPASRRGGESDLPPVFSRRQFSLAATAAAVAAVASAAAGAIASPWRRARLHPNERTPQDWRDREGHQLDSNHSTRTLTPCRAATLRRGLSLTCGGPRRR